MRSKLMNIFGKIFGCGSVGNHHLEDVLSKYIETDVTVDPELMEKHTKHVQRVIESLKNAFESPVSKQLLGGIKFKRVLESGSAFENLKVLEPDEFDVMLVFEPERTLKNQWEAEVLDKASLNTGYVNFDVQRKFIDGETGDEMKTFTKLELNNNILLETIDPIKFYNTIGDFMVKVLEKSTFEYHRNPLELDLGLEEPHYISTTRRRGPAVTITVKDSITGQTMSLDLVPTLELADGKLLVPKEKHWRQSYALREKELMGQIERNNKDMVDVFRFVKAKSCKERKISPLSMLDSYTYKNALFWFYQQKPNTRGLDTLLKEFFAFLEERFRSGKLPRYLEHTCNLLDRFDAEKLKFLANYLRNIREKDCYAEFIELNQTNNLDLNLIRVSNEINNNDNFKNNNLRAVVENLKNHFENRDVLARVGYECPRVEVVAGNEICLVFQLDAGSYLPIPSKVDDTPNYTPYKIIEKVTNEVLDSIKFKQIIGEEIQMVHTIENGVKISWGFVFTGHSELDPELIYQQVGLANTERFRVLIRSKLNGMRKSLDSIDGGIRTRVLNVLQRVVSKTGLNLDELLFSAVINKADDYRFSHSGLELIMLNDVVRYIAQCLEDGNMPSPVDPATNVLLDFNNLKDRLKEIFTLKVDRFHKLMFDP